MDNTTQKQIFQLNRIQEEDQVNTAALIKKKEGDGLDGLAIQASIATLSSIKNLGESNIKQYMADTKELYKKNV